MQPRKRSHTMLAVVRCRCRCRYNPGSPKESDLGLRWTLAQLLISFGNSSQKTLEKRRVATTASNQPVQNKDFAESSARERNIEREIY